METLGVSTFRTHGRITRGIATVIILTFGGLITSPAVAATRAELERQERLAPREQTQGEKLNAALLDVKAQLRTLAGDTQPGARTATAQAATADAKARQAARSSLASLRDELKALDQAARDDFRRIGEELEAKNLSDVILNRHADAVAKYAAEADALLNDLAAITSATADDSVVAERAVQAFERLDKVQLQRSHKPFDPEKLPFGRPDASVREPAMSPEEFSALGIAPDDGFLVASAAMASSVGFGPHDPANPEYLAATPDVQITPAIQQLAEELEHNPVKIHNWVHNNIEYLPTYGSIQGSQLTLDNRKGNAFDTASLTIALLRASGIPARYVYGIVEIPADQVMNWVGGVADPMAAGNLLGQGGIPHTALALGGEIKAFRLEHVWVETWVDFYPSRGAVNRVGDTWVPMDTSFKQYDYEAIPSIREMIPHDTDSLINRILSDAGFSEDSDSVTSLDAEKIEENLAQVIVEIDNLVNAQYPNYTIFNFLTSGEIELTESPILAGALPWKLLQKSAAYSEIPEPLKYRLTVNVYNTESDRLSELPQFSRTFNLASVASGRIAVRYVPASEDDQAIIDQVILQSGDSLPAYLINMLPVLEINGEPSATLDPIGMGQSQYFKVLISGPNTSDSRDFNSTVGDEIVLGIDAAGITEEMVSARIGRNEISAAENLHIVSLQYWMLHDAYNRMAAISNDVVTYRMPSFGLFKSPLAVQNYFGIPREANYRSRVMDVSYSQIMAVGKANQPTVAFAVHAGAQGSLLENLTFEMLFKRRPPGFE